MRYEGTAKGKILSELRQGTLALCSVDVFFELLCREQRIKFHWQLAVHRAILLDEVSIIKLEYTYGEEGPMG